MGVLSIEQVLAAEADAIHGVARGSVTEALQAHPSVQSSQSRRARKDADVRFVAGIKQFALAGWSHRKKLSFISRGDV